MDGLLSSDKDDLFANDSTVGTEEGQTDKSSIVPYAIKKDGELAKTTNAVSREDMDTVIKYGAFTASQAAKDIIAGKFDCKPARLGTIDACRFCRYKSVCHFNENEQGFEARNFSKLEDRDEVIRLMKEKMEEGE